MRRLSIALAVSLAILALLPAGASARGPQRNDSASGHGFVVVDGTTNYEFRFSAHTLSNTTTAATGNMFVTATQTTPTSITTISIWADVYCLSVVNFQAQIRGRVYRVQPTIGTPLDLVFDVDDLSSFTTMPDLFSATTEELGVPCPPIPPGGVSPVAKGDISVRDEPAF